MVDVPLPKIVWSPIARTSLRKAYEWIKEDSPTYAEKVKNTILKMIEELPGSPTRYPLDRFKQNNPGNYRAFEKYSYRITYRHTPTEVFIVRIRHVKQNPLLRVLVKDLGLNPQI